MLNTYPVQVRIKIFPHVFGENLSKVRTVVAKQRRNGFQLFLGHARTVVFDLYKKRSILFTDGNLDFSFVVIRTRRMGAPFRLRSEW